MGNVRDQEHDHQRKRKYTASSQSEITVGFCNKFQTYADEAPELLASISSLPGIAVVRSRQELSDDHHRLKKLKTLSTPESGSSTSEMSGVINTPGTDTLSTPQSKPDKYHHSSSSLSLSTYPLLSSQDSAKSTGSSSTLHVTLSSPVTSLLFSAGHENLREDAGFDEVMDFTCVARRLFESPITEGVLSLKSHLESNLLKRLKELSESEATFEVGREIVDSVHLLKLLGSSHRELEILGKKAGKGAFLLQEGLKLVREGQELLCSTMSNMPNSNDK